MKFNFESWEEFLDWNVKRENHIAEIQQHNYEQEMEIRKLKAELQKKRETISQLTVEINGGPVPYPIDDLLDDYS